MTYNEFLKSLKKNQESPLFLFIGVEDYLIEDGVRRLDDACFGSNPKDFDYDILYASQVDVGRILDVANAYPMMSPCRMVIVKELQKVPAKGLEALAAYANNPAKTTKLILIADKLNLRSKAASTIKSKSCYVECKPLYENKIPAWISEFVKGSGYEISSEASLLLQAYVGNNLRALVNEVEKITLNLNSKKKIETEDVKNVVGFSRKFSVFDLNDAIGGKKLEKSITILNKMLESGESHTAILAMITRHFVNLLKVKGLGAQKKSRNEIASLAGIPPFFVQKTEEMARKFSNEKFDDIFSVLLTTDLKLKTSQQSPEIALQTMLINILQ